MYSEEEKARQKQLAEERHNEKPIKYPIQWRKCLVAGAFGGLIVIIALCVFDYAKHSTLDETLVFKSEADKRVANAIEKTAQEKDAIITKIDKEKSALKKRLETALFQKQPAKLPDNLKAKIIGEMNVGDSAYTVPWAMMVSEAGECFLNGRYTLHNRPGGTVQMRVLRKKDGYHVYIPPDKKYSRDRGVPWVGATKTDLIPVKAVHTFSDLASRGIGIAEKPIVSKKVLKDPVPVVLGISIFFVSLLGFFVALGFGIKLFLDKRYFAGLLLVLLGFVFALVLGYLLQSQRYEACAAHDERFVNEDELPIGRAYITNARKEKCGFYVVDVYPVGEFEADHYHLNDDKLGEDLVSGKRGFGIKLNRKEVNGWLKKLSAKLKQ